jgi:hypothetical protein
LPFSASSAAQPTVNKSARRESCLSAMGAILKSLNLM